jgi:hypothetical protein
MQYYPYVLYLYISTSRSILLLLLLLLAHMGERRGAYRALMGKPEGRRPLGRPRRR